MSGGGSVLRALRRRLVLVALGGAALLFAMVVLFYRFSLADLSGGAALHRAVLETLEHVALPLLVLLLPVAWLGSAVVRSAFAPLERATAAIEAARGRERGFRIATTDMPDEALPFVDAVNDLLGRLDAAAARHEQFAADVAHELRTPLALLWLELDRIDDADAARLRGDVAGIRRLLDQLMLLAQIDAADAAHLAPAPVALLQLAEDVVAAMAPGIIGRGRTIALEVRGVPPTISGRRELIAAALRNLVENAERVTPVGGTVRVLVGPGGRLAVADGGQGLAADRLQRLVRRHARADHASTDGAGLGLSIVERIMAAHGGRLETDPEARQLSLTLPPGDG
jgi:signal transduction histidine kinase